MRFFDFVSIFFRSMLKTLLVLGLIGATFIIYLEAKLPSVENLKEVHLQVPLRIYTFDGKLIAEFGEKRRIPIKLGDVPVQFIHAVLATEDHRFFEHRGVDFIGIARACVNLVTKASREQGGSTITMQVARNFFLTRKKTFIRKFNEILLALKIEQELTKNEILELYLNVIYLGKRAYGIQAAAEVYYGTTVQNLNLGQIAVLAGLPQAPSSINPLNSPIAAKKRRKHVLDRMLAYNYIQEQEYAEAINSPIDAHYHGKIIELEAPYVAEMVRQDLLSRYDEKIYGSGYEVYTTIDSELQAAANQAVRQGLMEYDQRHGYRKSKLSYRLSQYENAEAALLSWKTILQTLPVYHDIFTGIVTTIESNQIWVLDKDNNYRDIPFKNMMWARIQQKDYSLGKAPLHPNEIVSIGDVIYFQPVHDGTLKLVQVPEASAALIALNPDNGAIKALVGGFDYSLSNFNRATQAERQVGSNFKPFIYTAAFAEGFTLASVVNDAPLVHFDPIAGPWRPQNDKNKFYGPTRLRVSLARSQNLVAVRLLQSIKIENMLHYASEFGFQISKIPPYLSMALGSGNVTPLELATAYSIFANTGYRVSPYSIDRILSDQGELIYKQPDLITVEENIESYSEKSMIKQRVVSPQIAYLTTSALQDAIRVGTGQKALALGRHDLAGKTGTTNDKLDAWYSGFNRNLVCTAWVGFDEPRTLKEYGSQVALPMWIYFMEKALKDRSEHPLKVPKGIISVRIDPKTGLLARPGQPEGIFEYFIHGTAPTQTAPLISELGENLTESLF